MANVSVLTRTITNGNSLDLPSGFIMASINPETGASFTFSSAKGGTSSAIETVFTFPSLAGHVYAQHTIAASGGSVQVSYITGA